MKPFSSPELEFALEAVTDAMKVTRAVGAQLAHMELAKEDKSPVTVADFAAQAVVAARLSQRFPNDKLLGEESSSALRGPEGASLLAKVTEFVKLIFPQADGAQVLDWIDHGHAKPEGRFWTLDPVDGTKGFLRGEQYAVAFALLDHGKVQVSVLGCPHLGLESDFQKNGPGTLSCAVRGQGAWITPTGLEDFKPLKVSDHAELVSLQVLRSVEASHANASNMESVFARHGIFQPPVLMDSQAKYAVVASGKADLFFYLTPVNRPEHRMKIWDVAPGSLVVEEAGGRTSDMLGAPLDFTHGETLAANPGIVITNGRLHDSALRVLRDVQASRQAAQ